MVRDKNDDVMHIPKFVMSGGLIRSRLSPEVVELIHVTGELQDVDGTVASPQLQLLLELLQDTVGQHHQMRPFLEFSKRFAVVDIKTSDKVTVAYSRRKY